MPPNIVSLKFIFEDYQYTVKILSLKILPESYTKCDFRFVYTFVQIKYIFRILFPLFM